MSEKHTWIFFFIIFFPEKKNPRMSKDMNGIILIFFRDFDFSTHVIIRTFVETYDTAILAQFFSKFLGFCRSHGYGLNSPVQIYVDLIFYSR